MSHNVIKKFFSDISAGIEKLMTIDLNNEEAFILILNESIDIQDSLQLRLFFRYVVLGITVIWDILNFKTLWDTTLDIDIKKRLEKILTDNGVLSIKIASVVTGVTPSMVDKHVGMILLLITDTQYTDIFHLHKIINR